MKSRPGTYALVLASFSEGSIPIGRIGLLEVRPGFYVYVGSAFGPGGLHARVSRHQKKTDRIHWHIDYLKASTRIDEVWYTFDPIRREHQWAQVLAEVRNASMPLPGFGSSDCGCRSHLYFFPSNPSGKAFRRKLHAVFQDHRKVYTVSTIK